MDNFDLIMRIISFAFIIYIIRCYYKAKEIVNLIDNSLDDDDIEIIKSELISSLFNFACLASIHFLVTLIFGFE